MFALKTRYIRVLKRKKENEDIECKKYKQREQTYDLEKSKKIKVRKFIQLQRTNLKLREKKLITAYKFFDIFIKRL